MDPNNKVTVTYTLTLDDTTIQGVVEKYNGDGHYYVGTSQEPWEEVDWEEVKKVMLSVGWFESFLVNDDDTSCDEKLDCLKTIADTQSSMAARVTGDLTKREQSAKERAHAQVMYCTDLLVRWFTQYVLDEVYPDNT